MKQFLKYINTWETYTLLGVFLLFISIGWYAKTYEGSDDTMKYVMIIVGTVGIFFLVASYISWKKKKRNKQL